MNPTISVSEDLNREPGYIIFTVSGVEGNVERLSYSVVRHGYDHNYLGEREWQAAFAWLEPEDAWYESGQLKFVVPPDVTWQMDPQGYVLKLNLYPPERELSTEFFWPDVPPAESATTPDVDHRLSGTRVKPATGVPAVEPQPTPTAEPETAPTAEPESVPIPEPDPVSTSEADPVPPPEPAVPPTEPKAGVEPAPEFTPSGNKKSGKDAVLAIGILVLVAVAVVFWFVLRPSVNRAPEQALQPSAPAANEAAEVPKPDSTTAPVSEPVVDPKPMVERSAPVETKVQVIQEKRANNTQITVPAVVQQGERPAQNSAPSTSGASGADTRDTLTEILDMEASKQPSPTEADIFKSIEPALREKVGE